MRVADGAKCRRLAGNETDAVECNASRLGQRNHAFIRRSTSRPSQNKNGIAAFVMKCCHQMIRRNLIAGVGNDNCACGGKCVGDPAIACGYDRASGVRANEIIRGSRIVTREVPATDSKA